MYDLSLDTRRLRVNNKESGTICKIYSKLTIKITDQSQRRRRNIYWFKVNN